MHTTLRRNELFDIYQGGFRSGGSYRAAMAPYIETLSRAYPGAAMALVGHEFHGGRSAVAWNQQTFPAKVTGASAHVTAATVHIYTVVNTVGINPANVAYRGPEFLSSAWQFPGAQHGDTTACATPPLPALPALLPWCQGLC
eukprot:COSAG05_NODE_1350_length_5113_cov_5.235540_4_plen_142_part_00